MPRMIARIASKPLIWLVQFYRYAISPMLPPRCRFTPTCSEYACEAIERYGPVKGVALAIRRVGKCHPWHPGGYDPIPHPTDNHRSN